MSETISVHNMFSPGLNNLSTYCGLVDAKIRASDKDLPVNDVTNKIFCKNYLLTSLISILDGTEFQELSVFSLHEF